jgi:chromosome segregation ATPase
MRIGDDIIDSRQVIARLDELQDEHEGLKEALGEWQEALSELADDESATEDDKEKAQAEYDDADSALSDWLEENESEFEALKTLNEVGESYAGDWDHGATLVLDSYFEDYARQLAEDIHGGEMRNASWPFDHIDWNAAAEALKADYTEIEVDGESYWVRQ